MERIRQALEQAEIDRKKSGVEDRQPEAPVTETPSEASGVVGPTTPVAPSVSTGKQVPVDQIQYTHTKCIDVSNKTMLDNNLVAGLRGNPLQDTYRMLRTRIMKEMDANGWRMLMVTGAHQGAGKTMTAANLAIAIAMDVNRTVLLVDADLRQPSVHEYFGYQPELGFSDALLHDAPVEDMLFHPNNIDRLVVLPGRERIGDSAEMLGSPRAGKIASEIKNRYDDRIVIVDAPPVLSSDDVAVTDRYVDAVLLVTEAGVTKRDELSETMRVLGDIPVLGTVLNKAPQAKIRSPY